ncbi:heptaprenylglyceryl phosphate synthase [Halobacillus sp. Marseille-Q1614]|uniref:heptaprenylglyceryl phosphate synthase n=1 Tax=Halobacillus sp. Marseille-Q1614 TaxID=2709134 RepID=UPI00156D616B|nr:heptaprenylglyceryl phosphate synthase [Halobacillus sp. Marseille-Q1614]
MLQVKDWQHVFKLDPNKPLDEASLMKLCDSGTDALMIGGTDGVTFEKVFDLWDRVQHYDITCVLELSNLEAIMPGFDGYLIPTVLNSKDKQFVVGLHHEAVKEYGDLIQWDDVLVEGYCVMNEQAKVYQETNCQLPAVKDVVAYAKIAEHMFHLPIFYLEYSGTWGDPKLVEEVSRELDKTLLFYGGGIESEEQARTMKQYADVIVVGNIIYEDIQAALRTVKACK